MPDLTPTEPHEALTAEALEERLERTLQLMATCASVPMHLWNDHSNAVLEALPLLAAAKRLPEVEAERDALRLALIASGTEAGAFLSNAVTTEFLLNVPGEIRRVMVRRESERDAANAGADALEERVRVLTASFNTLVEIAPDFDAALRACQTDTRELAADFTDVTKAEALQRSAIFAKLEMPIVRFRQALRRTALASSGAL